MLSRITAARRIPQIAARMYSTGRTEGSVAQSQGFNKKEKAHEDQYVRAHEAQLLQKIKDQIEQKKAELSELEKEHANIKSNGDKQ